MTFIERNRPALVLAPMEGVTDFPMRALLTEMGGFDYCVSEFFRISHCVPRSKVFLKQIPELVTGGKTSSGTPVQVQLLGGNSKNLAESAYRTFEAGAQAIDLNFGCPAPTVNRHDGGASLLRCPERIYEIIAAVRERLPLNIPVSAKLRLGWENPNDIFLNAEMAEKAGASWITIHARTKMQGYRPPAYWKFIGEVRRSLSIPVVANGDIWTIDDLIRCQEETGCIHFMIGRSALANPALPIQISEYLRSGERKVSPFENTRENWRPLLEKFGKQCLNLTPSSSYAACRIKQWLSMANARSPIEWIESVKKAQNLDEVFGLLAQV